MNDLALSLAMVSMLALLWGAWFNYRRHGPNLQTLLMVVMALVLLGNVVIWQLPPPDRTGEAADAEGAPPNPTSEAADAEGAPPNPTSEAADARSAPAAR